MEYEHLTPESAQNLKRMAEELMLTRQALEHALEAQGNDTKRELTTALQSVVILSDQVNEVLRRWLEHENAEDPDPQ